MKTLLYSLLLIAPVAIAANLHAGIPRPSPAPAAPAKPPMAECPYCDTTTITATRHQGGFAKNTGTYVWYVAGVKHTCSQCGGTIKIVDGATTNTMTKACPKCGPDAALCKAAAEATLKS